MIKIGKVLCSGKPYVFLSPIIFSHAHILKILINLETLERVYMLWYEQKKTKLSLYFAESLFSINKIYVIMMDNIVLTLFLTTY